MSFRPIKSVIMARISMITRDMTILKARISFAKKALRKMSSVKAKMRIPRLRKAIGMEMKNIMSNVRLQMALMKSLGREKAFLIRKLRVIRKLKRR